MFNPNVYRWCTVPQCSNTSISTPNKLFINVPMKKDTRNTWLNLARRNPAAISPNSVIYFCEDHFDLPNDMENYVQYRVMGSVAQVRMKPGCVPTKFECQPDRKITLPEHPSIKKQRQTLCEQCENTLAENKPTKHVESAGTSVQTSVLFTTTGGEVPIFCHKTVDKSVQAYITYKYRSKAVQTKMTSISKFTSPIKPEHCSVFTSPFKIVSCDSVKPGTSGSSKAKKRIFTIEEHSDSDVSYAPSTHSTQSHQGQSTSECSEFVEEKKKEETSNILKYTLIKIMKNPRSYLGLPKTCYFLIDLIVEETQIPANHVLLCLKKIRLNSPFREIGDDFSLAPTYASKIFFKNIPVLASIMRPFIVELDSSLTKRTLPMAFRHKFNKTSCIIDCLEIEMQKPSKAVNQALTWSEYKKCNTIKYLVSCTPNGLINYVSPGYGGRITDTCLVESCDFTKHLQPGMSVMADRGFKHVEQYLHQHNVQLVRPPSVATGSKLSKSEVKETKQIASLRIHVERVIRRVREFNMLKPHACLNSNFVKVLDDVIVIACGLINLQDSLIK